MRAARARAATTVDLARARLATEDCCVLSTDLYGRATYLPVAGVAGRLIFPPVSAACDRTSSSTAAIGLLPAGVAVRGCRMWPQAVRHTDARRLREPPGTNKPCFLHASWIRMLHVAPDIDSYPPAGRGGSVHISYNGDCVLPSIHRTDGRRVNRRPTCEVTCEPWRYFRKCAAIASSAPCVRWLSRKHQKQMAK